MVKLLSPEELEQAKQGRGYVPFEYWTGPKRVIPRHIRKGSSKSISPRQANLAEQPVGRHAAQPSMEDIGDTKTGLFPNTTPLDTTNQPRHAGAWRGIKAHASSVRVGQSPVYAVNVADSLSDMGSYEIHERHPWYNFWYWRKRTWALVIVAVAIVIVVPVVVGVVETEKKNNRYPDYVKLNYTLSDTYSGADFFDKFDYFVGYDPSHGHVHYVPQEQAEQLNLTYATADTAILRVDNTVGPNSVPNASTGRFSVRVESKQQYNQGLFIFDVKHSPFGCGSWPALWFADPSAWPAHGEIDVMEAVNQAADGNQMTLHTTSGCSMSVKRLEVGTANHADCESSGNDDTGCVVSGAESTFGGFFNAGGGGIMAMEWRNEGIRMWQFPRASIPADISSGSPDPSTWGTALADFPSTDCDIGSHFMNQSLIVDIDICGDLAGALYNQSGCPSDCVTFTSNNPSAFNETYWEFGSFNFYQAS